MGSADTTIRRVPTYCYQCVAGPDLLTVKVRDGVATEVEPNFCAAKVHPGGGKVCVKAYGLIQKTYNPNRVLSPMKRTNPRKGRDEEPGFVPISWEEAFETIAERLNRIRGEGLLDGSGYPRLAASFGGGSAWWAAFLVGAPASAAFVGALGTVISSLSSDVRTSTQSTSFFVGLLSLAIGYVLVDAIGEGVELQLAFAAGCLLLAALTLEIGARIISRDLGAS